MKSGILSLKRKQAGMVFILLAAILLVLPGCGSSNGSQGAGQASGSPSASSAPKADEVRMIKHAMGETPVTGTPKKVVVLTNEGLEAMLALGVKPVGSVRSFTGNPWYDHLKAEMDGVTDVGSELQPNVEQIASLKPDLIIGNKIRHEKIYEQLKAIAPTVFSETLRGEWKGNFSLYADTLNKKAEGQKVIADFDSRINDFKTKAGDKLKQKVSVVRFMATETRVYLDDTFSGVIFKQIGIARQPINTKETFVEKITKERIPEVDADMLFYFTYEVGDGKASKLEEEWTKEPLWQNLNVVKNKKAIKVNDVIWNTAGGVKAANLMLDELYKVYGVSK